MFEKDNLIIKIHGQNKFIAVKEAFSIGKVKFEFVTYDKNKASGGKVNQSIDIYMDIDKFTVLCEYLKSGRIYGMLSDADRERDLAVINDLIGATKTEAPKLLDYFKAYSIEDMSDVKIRDLKAMLIKKFAKQGGNTRMYENRQASPVFEDFGGSKRDGKVTSRVMHVLGGTKYPVLFKASEGPGREGQNHQYIPSYKEWNDSNSTKIQIPLSAESATAMGIAGLRAVSIYDIWVAEGTAEQNLERIRYSGDRDGASRGRGQAGGYSQPQQGGYAADNAFDSMPSAGEGAYQTPVYSDNDPGYESPRGGARQFGNRSVVW